MVDGLTNPDYSTLFKLVGGEERDEIYICDESDGSIKRLVDLGLIIKVNNNAVKINGDQGLYISTIKGRELAKYGRDYMNDVVESWQGKFTGRSKLQPTHQQSNSN